MTCPAGCHRPTPSQAHCTGCHRTFGSISGFDRHRCNGRCVDPAGLDMHTDNRGVWRFDGRPTYADAPSVPRPSPETAGNGPGVGRDTPGHPNPAQTNLEGRA